MVRIHSSQLKTAKFAEHSACLVCVITDAVKVSATATATTTAKATATATATATLPSKAL